MNTKMDNWVYMIKSKIIIFKNPETFKKNLWKKWRFRD